MPSLPPVPVAFRVPVSEGYADEGEAVSDKEETVLHRDRPSSHEHQYRDGSGVLVSYRHSHGLDSHSLNHPNVIAIPVTRR